MSKARLLRSQRAARIRVISPNDKLASRCLLRFGRRSIGSVGNSIRQRRWRDVEGDPLTRPALAAASRLWVSAGSS